MKIRETINNGSNRFTATAYENANKIIVVRNDNFIKISTPQKYEHFEFSSISDYETWKSTQSWIDDKKIKKVSPFKKVKVVNNE